MSDCIIVDVCNVVFQTTCRPPYKGLVSVRKLIRKGYISITEVEDAFVDEMLNTRYIDEENLRIRLVIDSSQKRRSGGRHYHTVARNAQRSISVDVVADADPFILKFVSPDSVRFNYYPSDNIYIVTNDRKLTESIYRAVDKIPEQERPNIGVFKVPTRRAENPIIPVVIDIAAAKKRGLLHLKSQKYYFKPL